MFATAVVAFVLRWVYLTLKPLEPSATSTSCTGVRSVFAVLVLLLRPHCCAAAPATSVLVGVGWRCPVVRLMRSMVLRSTSFFPPLLLLLFPRAPLTEAQPRNDGGVECHDAQPGRRVPVDDSHRGLAAGDLPCFYLCLCPFTGKSPRLSGCCCVRIFPILLCGDCKVSPTSRAGDDMAWNVMFQSVQR